MNNSYHFSLSSMLAHNPVSPQIVVRYLETLNDVKKLAASIHLMQQPPAAIIVDNLSSFEYAKWVKGKITLGMTPSAYLSDVSPSGAHLRVGVGIMDNSAVMTALALCITGARIASSTNMS